MNEQIILCYRNQLLVEAMLITPSLAKDDFGNTYSPTGQHGLWQQCGDELRLWAERGRVQHAA